MTDSPGTDKPVITIKKYANRRLYNTATSSYVTLEHLAQMVKEGVDFVVLDAKTNEDLTRQVLTQIIIEEEAKGENLLPINFLRQMIGFYGHGMQGLVPRYLDLSMESFSRNQQQIRSYMEETFTGLFPFGDKISEMGKRNMAMLEDAMKMFSPFPGAPNYPGDTMLMTGEITAITPNDSGTSVAIDFRGKNGMGNHVSGSALVDFPQGAGA